MPGRFGHAGTLSQGLPGHGTPGPRGDAVRVGGPAGTPEPTQAGQAGQHGGGATDGGDEPRAVQPLKQLIGLLTAAEEKMAVLHVEWPQSHEGLADEREGNAAMVVGKAWARIEDLERR